MPIFTNPDLENLYGALSYDDESSAAWLSYIQEDTSGLLQSQDRRFSRVNSAFTTLKVSKGSPEQALIDLDALITTAVAAYNYYEIVSTGVLQKDTTGPTFTAWTVLRRWN